MSSEDSVVGLSKGWTAELGVGRACSPWGWEGKNSQNACWRSGAPQPGGWGGQARVTSFERLGTTAGWLEPLRD